MVTRHGSLARSLPLLVAVATASGAASCRNKVSASLDAASDAAADDAATDSAASSASPTGPDGAAPESAAPATDAMSNLPRPTPFTGNYRCFKNGLHLEQTGPIVMATMHKDATTDTIIACTAIGDTCTGTVRDIHLAKTKGRKVDAVRPITLLRTGGGDVVVKLGHEQKAAGARSSSSSKAAEGDQTFCPRR